MTSKNSFFNILKICFRERLWGIAISCIFFFFAFPVYGALNVATIEDRTSREIFIKGLEPLLYAKGALGESNHCIKILTVALAIILAFNCFGYLYSKSKVDLFHSIPVKRESLFFAKYISGLVIYIVPYIAFMLTAYIVGAANGMLSTAGIKASFIMLFINFLGFLGVYNTAIIAIYLTGNPIVGLFGTGTLLLYGAIAQLLLMAYQSEFLTTYSVYSASNSFSLSPVSDYVNLTKDFNTLHNRYDIDVSNLVLYLIFVAAGLFIAVMLCKLRASESTGKSIAFAKIMPVLSVVLLIPITLGGAIFFKSVANSSINQNLGWYIFGFIIALVLGHIAIQAIFYLDFKSIFANLANPAIAGIISAIFAAALIFDLTGYNTYIPNDSSYESAAIASYSMQGNIEYYDYEAERDEYGYCSYNRDLIDYRTENMKITDKELIKEFVGAAIEDTLALEDFRNNAPDESTYFSKANVYSNVTVKFNLKNGKSVYREYSVSLLDHMDIYNKLYANDAYKTVVCPMLTLDPKDADNICYCDAFGPCETAFSKEDMARLVKAYQNDVLSQDVYSLRDEVPLGYLYKSISFESDNLYKEYCNDKKAYIYPSFTNTVAILKELGINTNYYKDSKNIARIVINDYSVASENGEALSMTYTKKSDIEALLEYIYPFDSTVVESGLIYSDNSESSRNLDVTVFFDSAPEEYNFGYGYAFVNYNIPKFVISDLDSVK